MCALVAPGSHERPTKKDRTGFRPTEIIGHTVGMWRPSRIPSAQS